MASIQIKNIVFDLGNVIINIDPALTAKAFQKIGLQEFDIQSLSKEKKQVLEKFETGLLKPTEFRNYIREISNAGLSDTDIDNAWNALLLDIPEERFELLNKLKTRYRLFLLSNTNEIHMDHVFRDLKKKRGVSDFSDYFEKEYYSYKIRLRKPDTEIYKYVLNNNELKAGETLFIDDSEENITGAKKLKINTYHLKPPSESILDIFLS